MRTHAYMQSDVLDKWAADSLSNEIMINSMAVIYMRGLYYVG